MACTFSSSGLMPPGVPETVALWLPHTLSWVDKNTVVAQAFEN